MIVTKDIRYGFLIWDLHKDCEPYPWPLGPYDDDTFILWKCCLNEFYSYCKKITNGQATIFGAGHLSNGQQIWVDVDKDDLIEAGVDPEFMSQNYHDWPEREMQ